jgi:hypothetical protein
MAATKIDLAREFGKLYKPGRRPELIEVPELPFLMIDGHGDPNASPEYRQAIEALFSVSYTIKFTLKLGPKQLDYKVMPLESLWWSTAAGTLDVAEKPGWSWTAMIAQPEEVDDVLLEEAKVAASGRRELPALPLLRLERFDEGLSAQVMHVGPYSAEGPTIERLHAFIAEQGYELRGKHHEIYLGDPRRAAPEKLKTVVRQPVAPSNP